MAADDGVSAELAAVRGCWEVAALAQFYRVCGASLELPEQPDVDALEAALVDALGLDAGRRWPFHLTLAYRRPGAEGELSQQACLDVAAAVASCVGSAPIPLGLPTVCAFEDMTLFAPWRAEAACDARSAAPPSLEGVPTFSRGRNA